MKNLKAKLQASLIPNTLQKEILDYVAKLEARISELSWTTNPDRMGGCYAEDEKIDCGWK